MRKTTRKGKADGGSMPGLSNMHRTLSSSPYGSRSGSETAMWRAKGGGVSAKSIAQGKPAGIRKGSSPAKALDKGFADAKKGGNLAKSIGMGKPTGQRMGMSHKRVRFAEGGHASDDSQERFKKAKERNDILGSPHYAEGGKVHQGMKALYHALHSHFENEPQMKKLGATKSNVYEGEPHRAATFKKYRPQ